MKDDSALALRAKEQVRKGTINLGTFTSMMENLKRAGKDRIVVKQASPASRKAPATLVTMTAATTADVTSHDSWTEGEAPGPDSGIGLRRNVSTDVLRKLGGRLGLPTGPTRQDTSGGPDRQSGSPIRDGANMSGSARRQSRSPRQNAGSPRHGAGAAQENGGSGSGGGPGLGWRPWSLSSSNTNRIVGRRASSVPSSPTNRLGSATGGAWGQGSAPATAGSVRPPPLSVTPVRGAGNEDRGGRQPISVARGQQAVGQQAQHGAGGPPGPLTASEIDNLSSVSNTSTVLTDLSLRLEKIEDMLSRLLEVHKHEGRLFDKGGVSRGGGGGPREVKRDGVEAAGVESVAGIGVSSRAVVRDSPEGDMRLSSVTLRDTAKQLQEARGQLQRLEAVGVAPAQLFAEPTEKEEQDGARTDGPSSRQPMSTRVRPSGSSVPPDTTDTNLAGNSRAQSREGTVVERVPEEKKDEGDVGDELSAEEQRGTDANDDDENVKNEESSRVDGAGDQSVGASNAIRLTTISESPR